MIRLIRKIIFSIGLLAIVWTSGLLWYVSLMPTSPSTDRTVADAIVVLTGGSKRLESGLDLLAQGEGRILFVSGVSEIATLDDLIERASPNVRDWLLSQPELPVVLGNEAVNTIGNAEETARWIRAGHYKTVRLVTSNYHMPRSLSEFQQVLPDITFLPNPVFSSDFPVSGWWKNPKSRELVGLEYHKFLGGKFRHLLLSLTENP